MKRVLCFVLCLVMMLSFIPAAAPATKAATMTLAQLQQKYPTGAYWNHYVSTVSECGDMLGSRGDESFGGSVTSTPCASHSATDYNYYVGKYDCNYFDGAFQCMGFARRLGYEAFGSRVTSWSTHSNKSSIKPGDVVQIWGPNVDANYGHTVFVAGISGSVITVGEANLYNAPCQIRWGSTYNLNSYSVKVYSAPRTLDTSLELTVNWGPNDSKHWVGDTNAVLANIVYLNIDNSAISEVGIYLYDYSGKQLTGKREGVAFSGRNQVEMWYDLNGELGYTILPGTPYKYRFVARVNGKDYYSDMYSFTSGGAHTHKYDSGTVTKSPTCTATGTRTYTCTTCGGKKTESIAAKGHSWKDATCTAAKTCTVCGATSGSALGHNYSGGSCTRCGDIPTIIYENLGDDFYAYIGHPASGHGLSNVGGNAELGNANTAESYWHFVRQSDGSYKIYSKTTNGLLDVTDAKTADGTNIQVWPNDGQVMWQKWYIVKANGGYAFCSAWCYKMIDIYKCGPTKGTNAQLHTANQTEAQIFTITKECNHYYIGVVTQEATCVSAGTRKYTCSHCGDSYTTTIAARGHNWQAATCTTAQTCLYCGTTAGDALGHDYSGCTCVRCDDVKPGSDTSVVGHSFADGACEKCGVSGGNCGSDLLWILNADGVLKISGTGEMADYDATKTPWYNKRSWIKTVELSDGITNIGNNAFYDCYNLSNITIPNTVTKIGYDAFDKCIRLSAISIPESVTQIGYQAFCNCDSLTSVTIPDSVTMIGERVFIYCDNLTTVEVGSGVTNIPKGMFEHCPKLESVICKGRIEGIGDSAFYYCTGLSDIMIPEGVTSIGSYAFAYCGSLTNVVLPNGVVNIDEYAFGLCTGLTSVTIPESVTTIGRGVFNECAALENVYYAGTQAQWDAIDVSGYNDSLLNATLHCQELVPECLVYEIANGQVTITGCDTSATGDLIIPDEIEGYPVTRIGNMAFFNCTKLTSIVIPNSVTSIGEAAFLYCSNLASITIPAGVTSISKGMFNMCYSLTSITIPDGVTSIGEGAFIACCGLTDVTIPNSVTGIGDNAFWCCCGLTSITIPESVNFISDSAFYNCSSLTGLWVDPQNSTYCSDDDGVLYNKDKTILMKAPAQGITGAYTILDSVTSIGSYAFEDCTSLTSITIPSSVTSIGSYAFGDCTSLTDVYYTGTQAQWNAISIKNGNTDLQDATLHCQEFVPECLVYEIANGQVIITGCDTAATGEVVIPAKIQGYPVTKIGAKAFENCAGLTNIIIPDSVTTIGASAFAGCNGLTTVTIPDSVTDAGEDLFGNCASLQTVHLGDGICKIPSYFFRNCKNLETVTLGDYVTDIGTFTFYNCRKLANLTLPETVAYIGDNAFYNCFSLTRLNVPANVAKISDKAFYGCSNVTAVTIPVSVTKIGHYAFYNCTKLTDVYYMGTPEQWEAIAVGSDNDCLKSATVHYVAIQEQENGTILVLDDTAMQQLTVAFGQVLDLNGKVLTVESLASFGQIIDSVGGGGLIVTNFEATGNDWLPILDNTGCYRFYEYEQENLGTKTSSDGVVFGFAWDFADDAAYTTLLGCEDVQVTVTLSWGAGTQTFAFSTELLQRYVKLHSLFPDMQACMMLNVTGLDSLEEGTVITVTPSVTAVGGKLQNIGDEMQYIA